MHHITPSTQIKIKPEHVGDLVTILCFSPGFVVDFSMKNNAPDVGLDEKGTTNLEDVAWIYVHSKNPLTGLPLVSPYNQGVNGLGPYNPLTHMPIARIDLNGDISLNYPNEGGVKPSHTRLKEFAKPYLMEEPEVVHS